MTFQIIAYRPSTVVRIRLISFYDTEPEQIFPPITELYSDAMQLQVLYRVLAISRLHMKQEADLSRQLKADRKEHIHLENRLMSQLLPMLTQEVCDTASVGSPYVSKLAASLQVCARL